MSTIISDYQRWKQQGENLRTQAKVAMEVRYRELLLEAVQIAEEYREDFGASLKLPPSITSFRYKTVPKGKKAKPAAKGKPAAGVAAKPAAAAPKAEPVVSKPDPRISALQKKLDTARKKLDAAKASGAPTKNLEDKVYEIEDELRLLSQPS